MESNPQPFQQIPSMPVTLAQVSAKEFAAKFKSKRECYQFLAVDCNVYLPPYGKCLSSAHANQLFFQKT